MYCKAKIMGVEPPDAIGIDKTEAQLLVPRRERGTNK
jgi:hypothetical protein